MCGIHLIVGVSGYYPSLPMILWDAFIPQVNITINLLRNSRINGQFDCNKTLLVTPGFNGIIHETLAKKITRAVHGTTVYFTDLALQYYRCYEVTTLKNIS